jgi:hypothetical protein
VARAGARAAHRIEAEAHAEGDSAVDAGERFVDARQGDSSER